MFQRLRLGDCCQLLFGIGTERTAGCGQYHFLYRVAHFSGQTLENSGMFGIDGQDRGAAETCQVVDEFTGHYQGLFIGEGYRFTGTYGVHGRLQSGITYHGGQYHVYRGFRYNLREGFLTGIHFNGQVGKSLFQLLVFRFVGYYHRLRLEFPRLGNEVIHAVVGCQHIRLVPVGMFLYDL